MRSFFFSATMALVLAAGLAVAGCASAPADRPIAASTSAKNIGRWTGPAALPQVTTEPWTYGDNPGQILRSTHYVTYSTVSDPELRLKLAVLMESAHEQYRALAPGVPDNNEPMTCFVFGRRKQWEDFTRANTGKDASIYLQISRGGYTIRDWYVSYDIGPTATLSVAAHEGWHQYVARNFRGRLPPFLEEGIATLFERVRWDSAGGQPLPRWNLTSNPNRAQALRSASEKRNLFPLEQLIRLHAGMVVGKSGGRIEAFYAQSWAFARFMWEAEGGKYRPAFQKLLTDVAMGTVVDPSRSHAVAGGPWNPGAVKPLLEHYMQMPLPEIETAYLKFVQKIAYDDYADQFDN